MKNSVPQEIPAETRQAMEVAMAKVRREIARSLIVPTSMLFLMAGVLAIGFWPKYF